MCLEEREKACWRGGERGRESERVGTDRLRLGLRLRQAAQGSEGHDAELQSDSTLFEKDDCSGIGRRTGGRTGRKTRPRNASSSRPSPAGESLLRRTELISKGCSPRHLLMFEPHLQICPVLGLFGPRRRGVLIRRRGFRSCRPSLALTSILPSPRLYLFLSPPPSSSFRSPLRLTPFSSSPSSSVFFQLEMSSPGEFLVPSLRQPSRSFWSLREEASQARTAQTV